VISGLCLLLARRLPSRLPTIHWWPRWMRCAPHHAIRVSYRSRLIAEWRRRWRNLTHQKTGLSQQRTFTHLTSPSVEIFVGKPEGLFVEMSVRVSYDVGVNVTCSCINIIFSNIHCLMCSKHKQNHSHIKFNGVFVPWMQLVWWKMSKHVLGE
jgi:hypothetical protein